MVLDMGFELRVIRNNPLTGESDLDQALKTFLRSIGYLPEAYQDDIGFKLIRDCLLAYPDKAWTVNELLTELESSRSTLYRYLNKLKGLDILEEVTIPLETVDDVTSKKTRKGYRIRYRSLSLAWSLVESHTQVAMDNYRKSVEHIESLAKEMREEKLDEGRKNPSITVDGIVVRKNKKGKGILLVKRGKEPYRGMWALPGGFVEYGERTEDAVLREVNEETGIECEISALMTVASKPDRDPRGHTISVVYILEVKGDEEPNAGDDAAKASWYDIDDLPPLAFDHGHIIKKYLDENG